MNEILSEIFFVIKVGSIDYGLNALISAQVPRARCGYIIAYESWCHTTTSGFRFLLVSPHPLEMLTPHRLCQYIHTGENADPRHGNERQTVRLINRQSG